MKKPTIFLLAALIAVSSALPAFALKPRMVFEKHLWAEGVNPEARHLDRLMVKFLDEDMVRLRNGALVSTNGRSTLTAVHDFLSRHPEISVDVIIKSESETEYAARTARIEQQSGKDLVDLFSFYRFTLPNAAADPKSLLADILKAPEVETAYYEPIPLDATCTDLGSTTPNLMPEQGFHDAAPVGVDLGYAQTRFGADVVDGAGTSVFVGIFERGMQTTHEDFTSAVVATAGTPDTDNDHGTAVTGVLGSCDDNNVGGLGFVADEQMRLYQRNSSSYGSVADVYNLANSQLIAGEITNSSWGYQSDPMPPGQTCPCNPGQNGNVPPEYDPSVKSAIDAGTAAGIHYFLAACNGCTDLDDAVFGSTFDWTTGSVYVGAVVSTGDHDATCFTNFGSRVTSCAWGENVTTTGYGTRWNGTAGTNEWYTSGFNGTSSASPIVCGVAGVLNNIYRSLNSGANIATTTMRSWLQTGATPAGNVTPGNIGVMPNLFGITAPDLNPDVRSGWTDYIVPRNSGDADGSNCTLPATLVCDPDTTFWNTAIENTSNFGNATSANYRLYIDDAERLSATHTNLGPLGRTYFVNADATSANVRGGRHSARVTCDPLDVVNEYFEDNNSWTDQYVWNPRPLTAETALLVTAPPLKTVTGQTSTYYNCDGYSFSSGFSGNWDLFGVMSETSGADYDARVYSEAVTSTNGFDDYETWSSYIGSVDIVGRNQHVIATSAFASAINWDASSDDYAAEGETSTYVGIPGYARMNGGSYSMTANELMEAVEFQVDELVPYEIEAHVSSGNANLAISVFNPTLGYFQLSQRSAFANDSAAGQSEHLSFTPTATGYHLALIHKYNSADWGQTAGFTVYLGKAMCDLTHHLNTGWSHEIVVRQTSAAVPAVLPATLNGNTTTNYLNAGLTNQGYASNPTGVVRNRFYLDGPGVLTTTTWGSWPPNSVTYWANLGPIFVFGGRHSIGDSIDVDQAAPEWLEDNNRHDEQFVWMPYAMTNMINYLTGNPAPNFRNTQSSTYFAAWNQDGWRFADGGHWSGVAACPNGTSDYYVMGLYPASTGSEDGFDSYLVPSFSAGAGGVSFVVENGNINTATTFDVGVTNNYAWPTVVGVDAYRTWQCNSMQDLVLGASNGTFTLGTNQLMHVYDLQMTAGVPARFILDNLGAVDLGLAIFDPTDAYGSRSSLGTVVNSGGDGADETVTFTPAATGRHGIVVFKNDYSDLGSCSYRLILGDRTPAPPQGMVLQVINSATDPIQMRAHWDSVLVDVNGAPMNVDHYQIYYTLDPDLNTFPAGWTAFVATTQATLNFTVSSAVLNLRMIVTAVDADGYVLSHSDLPGGRDLRGETLPSGTNAVRDVLPAVGGSPGILAPLR